MKHFNAFHMIGFNAQLKKEAAPATNIIQRMLQSASGRSKLIRKGVSWGGAALRSPGTGHKMLGGAAVGAGGGALAGEEGRKLERAIQGGLLGAGAVGGHFLATKKGRQWLKDRGVENRYYLTGKGVKDRAHAKELDIIPSKAPTKLQAPKGLSPEKLKAHDARAELELAKDMKVYNAKQEAYDKGYLNIPGMAHGLMSRDAGNVVRSGWQRQGGWGKAFLGLGALETGRSALTPSQPGGPGRGQRTLEAAGRTAGWLVAPHAMLPGMASSAAVGKAGSGAGRVADWGAGKVTPRKVPAPNASDY